MKSADRPEDRAALRDWYIKYLFWLETPGAQDPYDGYWKVETKAGFKNEGLVVLKNKNSSEEWEVMKLRELSLWEWGMVEGLRKGEFGKLENREGKLVLKRERKGISEEGPQEFSKGIPKECLKESPKEISQEWEEELV